MEQTVLFSPIGNTDPVRNNCDGPMLHILRHYRPARALLFLSRRMEELEDKNPRLEALARHVSPGTEIILHRSGIEDVSDFTAFQQPFQECLRRLHADSPGCPILLNITSGSPQMNAELCIQASVSMLPLRPIQVLTPTLASNHDVPHLDENAPVADILAWLLDGNPALQAEYDVHPPANRCREVRLTNYVRQILFGGVRHQLAQGDFIGAAAAAHAQDARGYFDQPVLDALAGASARQTFDIKTARHRFASAGLPDIPIQDAPLSQMVEYYLRMRHSFVRGDYAPFVLYISPLAQEACRWYMQQHVMPQLDHVIRDTPRGSQWDMIALQRIYPQAYNLLAPKIYRDNKPPNLSFWHLICLLNEYVRSNPALRPIHAEFEWLRDIEEQLRNRVAHQLTTATRSDLEGISGMSVDQLLKRLDSLMQQVFAPRLTREVLDSYDAMAATLAQMMDA